MGRGLEVFPSTDDVEANIDSEHTSALHSSLGASMLSLPEPSAKIDTGTFDPTFIEFTRRILSVPHSEIKAKLDAEREAKRTPKRASRVSGAPSKAH